MLYLVLSQRSLSPVKLNHYLSIVLTEEFVFLSYMNAIKMSYVVALYLFGAFRMYKMYYTH